MDLQENLEAIRPLWDSMNHDWRTNRDDTDPDWVVGHVVTTVRMACGTVAVSRIPVFSSLPPAPAVGAMGFMCDGDEIGALVYYDGNSWISIQSKQA